MEKALAEEYYTLGKPGAYGSVHTLFDSLNGRYSRRAIKKWLDKQDVQTKFKKRNKRFKRRRVLCYEYLDLCQIDLMFFPEKYNKYNDGISILCVLVDCFSKYAYAIPLVNKSAAVVLDGFKQIMAQLPRPMKNLSFDRGKEWLNKDFKTFLTEKNINFYTNENKRIGGSFLIERFIRTAKKLFHKAMEDQTNYRWLDMVESVMKTYNGRKHSSIGMSPEEGVKKQNSLRVKEFLFGAKSRYKPVLAQPVPDSEIRIGSFVRVSVDKKAFQKESADLNFTIERFKVTNIDRTSLPYIFKLEDQAGLPVNMSFYVQELSLAGDVLDTDEYKIEYVIKTRKNKSFIKWEGFPISQASWVTTKNIKNLF
jgi:hypothetical protein